MKKLITLIFIVTIITACSSPKIEGVQGKVKRDALSIVSKYPGRIINIMLKKALLPKKEIL